MVGVLFTSWMSRAFLRSTSHARSANWFPLSLGDSRCAGSQRAPRALRFHPKSSTFRCSAATPIRCSRRSSVFTAAFFHACSPAARRPAPLICTAPFFAPLAERWPGPVIYYSLDYTYAYQGLRPRQVLALDRRLCRTARLVCPVSVRIAGYFTERALRTRQNPNSSQRRARRQCARDVFRRSGPLAACP
jgi:hypothetical protein